jgi:hypothetical protein
VLTDVGAVELAVPRDRAGTFEPQIVRKDQTQLEGSNERIITLYAQGMTTRDIRAHLREMYNVEVSPDLIESISLRCSGGWVCTSVPAAGKQSPKVIANAFSARFQRTAHRVRPVPVGSWDRVAK